jgi:hypothetical protein
LAKEPSLTKLPFSGTSSLTPSATHPLCLALKVI